MCMCVCACGVRACVHAVCVRVCACGVRVCVCMRCACVCLHILDYWFKLPSCEAIPANLYLSLSHVVTCTHTAWVCKVESGRVRGCGGDAAQVPPGEL